jgi:hypothetical protein
MASSGFEVASMLAAVNEIKSAKIKPDYRNDKSLIVTAFQCSPDAISPQTAHIIINMNGGQAIEEALVTKFANIASSLEFKTDRQLFRWMSNLKTDCFTNIKNSPGYADWIAKVTNRIEGINLTKMMTYLKRNPDLVTHLECPESLQVLSSFFDGSIQNAEKCLSSKRFVSRLLSEGNTTIRSLLRHRFHGNVDYMLAHKVITTPDLAYHDKIVARFGISNACQIINARKSKQMFARTFEDAVIFNHQLGLNSDTFIVDMLCICIDTVKKIEALKKVRAIFPIDVVFLAVSKAAANSKIDTVESCYQNLLGHNMTDIDIIGMLSSPTTYRGDWPTREYVEQLIPNADKYVAVVSCPTFIRMWRKPHAKSVFESIPIIHREYALQSSAVLSRLTSVDLWTWVAEVKNIVAPSSSSILSRVFAQPIEQLTNIIRLLKSDLDEVTVSKLDTIFGNVILVLSMLDLGIGLVTISKILPQYRVKVLPGRYITNKRRRRAK